MNEPAGKSAAVHTSGRAGLMHHNGRKVGQGGLEALPNPLGQHFAGGVAESFDLVQIIVIQQVHQGCKGLIQFCKILNPTGVGVHGACDMDLTEVAVAMQPPALMAFWRIGQAVGGFKANFSNNGCATHGRANRSFS